MHFGHRLLGNEVITGPAVNEVRQVVGPIRSWTYNMGVCPERFSDAGRTRGNATLTFEGSAHETGGSADVAPNPSARERGEFATICTAPPLNCASACCELAPLDP